MIGRQASELGQAILYPGQHSLLVVFPSNESALAGAHIPATNPTNCISCSDTAHQHCLLAARERKEGKGCVDSITLGLLITGKKQAS